MPFTPVWSRLGNFGSVRVLVAVGLLTGATAGHTQEFGEHAISRGAIAAQSVHATDVDGDGYADVVSAPGAGTEDLLAVAWHPTNSPVFRIDSSTGDGHQIGHSSFSELNSMTRTVAGSFLSVGSNGALVEIDPQTGIGTQIATIDITRVDVRALAASPGGELFAVHELGPFEIDELWMIDLETGHGTLIGQTGFDKVQGLTFSPDGRLFAWDLTDGLLLVDPTTGAASDVDSSVLGGPIQTLAFLSDTSLVGVWEALFSIDPESGEFFEIGAGDYADVRGVEFDPGSCILLIDLERQVYVAGEEVGFEVYLHHRHRRTATVPLTFWIEDSLGRRVSSRTTAPLVLNPGDRIERTAALPLPEDLPAGKYSLFVGTDRMQQGIVWRQLRFRVAAPDG